MLREVLSFALRAWHYVVTLCGRIYCVICVLSRLVPSCNAFSGELNFPAFDCMDIRIGDFLVQRLCWESIIIKFRWSGLQISCCSVKCDVHIPDRSRTYTNNASRSNVKCETRPLWLSFVPPVHIEIVSLLLVGISKDSNLVELNMSALDSKIEKRLLNPAFTVETMNFRVAGRHQAVSDIICAEKINFRICHRNISVALNSVELNADFNTCDTITDLLGCLLPPHRDCDVEEGAGAIQVETVLQAYKNSNNEIEKNEDIGRRQKDRVGDGNASCSYTYSLPPMKVNVDIGVIVVATVSREPPSSRRRHFSICGINVQYSTSPVSFSLQCKQYSAQPFDTQHLVGYDLNSAGNWLMVEYVDKPCERAMSSVNACSRHPVLSIHVRPVLLPVYLDDLCSAMLLWKDIVSLTESRYTLRELRCRKLNRIRDTTSHTFRPIEVNVQCDSVDLVLLVPTWLNKRYLVWRTCDFGIRTICSPDQNTWSLCLSIGRILSLIQFPVSESTQKHEILSLNKVSVKLPLHDHEKVQFAKLVEFVESSPTMSYAYCSEWLETNSSARRIDQRCCASVDECIVSISDSDVAVITSVINALSLSLRTYVAPEDSFARIFHTRNIPCCCLDMNIHSFEVILQNLAGSSKYKRSPQKFRVGSHDIEVSMALAPPVVRCVHISTASSRVQLTCSRDDIEIPLMNFDLFQHTSEKRRFTIAKLISRPVDIWFCQESSYPLALAFVSTACYLQIYCLSGHIDTSDCIALSDFITESKVQTYHSREWFVRLSRRLPHSVLVVPSMHVNNTLTADISPLVIALVDIERTRIDMLHHSVDVGFILAKSIGISSVTYILPGLYQVSGRVLDVCIADLTEEKSFYKNVVECVQSENAADVARPVVEFHMTSYLNAKPLLEVNSHNLRVVYLQRAVMTIISYIRDCALAELFRSVPYKSTPVVVSGICNDDLVYTALSQALPVLDPGVFRFAWNISNSEFHLPVNSRSDDGLVFVFKRLYMYSLYVDYEFFGKTGYSMGPLCSDRHIWLSKYYALKSLCSEISTTSRCWDVTAYPNHLLSPIAFSQSHDSSNLKHETQLAMNLTDSVICTWCSDNTIAKGLNIGALLTIQEVHQAPSGLYSSVFNSLGFISMYPFNIFATELMIEEVDWVLSRGQYMAIVLLIQQNFPELTKVVPPLPCSVPCNVHLNTNLFGKRALEDRLPFHITVPLDVEYGRIHMIEDNKEYYRRLFSSHQAKSKFVKDENYLLYVREETENFVTHWFDSEVRLETENDCEVFEQFNCFQVPNWSFHHTFRKYMEFGFKNYVIAEDDVLCGDSGSDSDSRTNRSVNSLDSIGIIFFTSLEFNFLRQHHGGGISIVASAKDFVITRGSNWDSFHSGCRPEDIVIDSDDDSFDEKTRDPLNVLYDIDDIPEEFIIVKQTPCLPESIDPQSFPDVERRSIHYFQNGMANLRRCIVELDDCIAVVHIPALMRIINFFVECITLTDMREKDHIDVDLDMGRFNFRALLDVEIYATNTVVCFPNYTFQCQSDTRGLCVGMASLQYTHTWRGLIEAGPGWVGIQVIVDIGSVFISPLDELGTQEIESVVSPLKLMFSSHYCVSPPASNAMTHFEVVRRDVDVPFPSAQDIRENRALSDHVMLLTLKPASPPHIAEDDEDDGVISPRVPDHFSEKSQLIDIKVSIPDMMFINAVQSSLCDAYKSRKMRPPIRDSFRILFQSFHDIAHTWRLTDILSYVPNSDLPSLRVSDFILDTADFHVLIRNNTYGVKIARILINEPRFSFNKSRKGINIAGSLDSLLYLHNPKMGKFEPAIESLKVTAICATDVTSTSQERPSGDQSQPTSNTTNKLRFDMYFEPVEVNVAQSMYVGTIGKLSLGDVITSKSASLPVYRIVNRLGVAATCLLNVGRRDESVVSKELGVDEVLAVDTRLYDAHRGESRRTRQHFTRDSDKSFSYSGLSFGFNNTTDESHTIELLFEMDNLKYKSQTPVPIDNEGLFQFIMKPMMNSYQARERNLTDDFVDISAPPELLYAQKPGSNNIAVLMSMRVVDTSGTRELELRSICSLRNDTECEVQFQAELCGSSVDVTLKPDEEWFLPVYLISSQTSIHMRLADLFSIFRGQNSNDDQPSRYLVKALPSLYSFVHTTTAWVGSSVSLKMRASLVTMFRTHSIDNSYDELAQWTCMLLPEPLDVESCGDGDGTSKTTKKRRCVVKYPTADSFTQEFLTPSSNSRVHAEESPTSTGSTFRRFSIRPTPSKKHLNDVRENMENEPSMRQASDILHQRIVPSRLCIVAPIRFVNLFCQPIVYRFAEKRSALNCSEGTLIAGGSINLYHNPLRGLNVSIRVLNYKWSNWIRLPVFPPHSKTSEEILESLRLIHEDHPIRVPPLTFNVSCHDRNVKVVCPLWLINRTGMNIHYAEGVSMLPSGERLSTRYIPHRGQQRIETSLVHIPPSGVREGVPLERKIFKIPMKDRVGRHSSMILPRGGLLQFTVCSPFDHCKAVVVSLPGSCTVDLLVMEVLKKLLNAANYTPWVSDGPLPHDPAGFINGHSMKPSDYLLFHLSEQGSTLSAHPRAPVDMQLMEDSDSKHSTSDVSVDESFSSKQTGHHHTLGTDYGGSDLDALISLGLNVTPFINENGTTLRNDTQLHAVPEPRRLLLCHASEFKIVDQLAGVKMVPKRKESSVVSMLGFKKYLPVMPFRYFDGDIPFNPMGVLGMFPSFSVCIPNETEWSDAVNVQKVDFDVTGSRNLDLVVSSNCQTTQSELYELSLLVKHGEGIFKGIAAVTIVPRLILSSKLPFALQIRQVVYDETGAVTESSAPFMLLPGSIQQFHHPLRRGTKLVQMMQYSSSNADENLSMEWGGELSLTVLGVTHVRLRNPDKIVNVRVESVGSSLYATLSLQNAKWPPYRVENMTSFKVRVKQVCKKLKREPCQEDTVSPRSSIPYAWDYCFNYSTEKMLLQVDFAQIGNRWTSIEFPMNEVDHTCEIALTRLLPDLRHPITEGTVDVRSHGSSDWKSAYCVVHNDMMYMFTNSMMNEIVGVINLSLPNPSSDEDDMARDRMMFASVRLHTKREWDITSMFSSTIGLQSAPSELDGMKLYFERLQFWDVNSLRRAAVRIGACLGVFESIDLSEDPSGDESSSGEASEVETAKSFSVHHREFAMKELRSVLRKGYTVDNLVSIVSETPLLCADILNALVVVGEAPNEKYAYYLLKEMCSRAIIKRAKSEKFLHTEISDSSVDVSTSNIVAGLQFSDLLLIFPPSLATELSISTAEDNELEPSRESFIKSARPNCEYRFEVSFGSSMYKFRCSSEADLWRWLYSIRLCIEKTWVEHIQHIDRHSTGNEISTVDSLETTVKLKVRTDGPMKVLELTEESALFPTADSSEVEADTALGSGESHDESEPHGDELKPPSAEVNVSVFFPSIGFSLVDNDPTELVYLRFRDIQISIERTTQRMLSALTIQYIQIDNQLLNPLYPVSFRPRTNHSISGDCGDGKSQKKVLMLPGLQQIGDDTFPTVHGFIQQRLDVGTSTTAFGLTTTEDESDLLYFDLFSLWIAPVELSIDEEIFVRVLRVLQALRSANSKAKAGKMVTVDGEALNEKDPYCASACFTAYQTLNSAGVNIYVLHSSNTRPAYLSKNIYFSLLQLHPVDLVLSIRSTPDFKISTTEDNFLTLAVRVDYGRIRLNALMINNVFGMTSFITSILSKHYTYAALSQIYALIGSTDVIEGSVGLLSNLGTGVYDLFYEPIEGLLGDEQTFIEGLSKGSKSLATRAIGGTSAFTSKITGGLGKGMSLLTLDSRYQKSREKDRLKAAQSVSEGLYYGSYEFGKNVYQGVTGIVVEPYRGWVEEGGVGLGMGIAKGILGVALKPAVGVLDLASRTTEGIRHAAFNTRLEADYLNSSGRCRLPRQFGRDGELLFYTTHLSTLQMIVDKLTIPTRELRFYVVHALPIVRSYFDAQLSSEGTGGQSINSEIRGYALGNKYFVLTSVDRIMLLKVEFIPNKPVIKVSISWTCPTDMIEQFYSDSKEDTLLVIREDSRPLIQHGEPWNSPYPTIQDPFLMDYFVFQECLEKLLGQNLAREHPMVPDRDKAMCITLSRKRTGIKSIVHSTTRHEYRLYKYVLYEFTEIPKEISDQPYKITDSGEATCRGSPEVVFNALSSVGTFFEEVFETRIPSRVECETEVEETQMLLTTALPLIDMRVCGPDQESAAHFSITLKRRSASTDLELIKREDLSSRLKLSNRDSLKLIFDSRRAAQNWKIYIAESSASVMLPSGAASGLFSSQVLSNSVKRNLVIPLSGTDLRLAENLKIEIAKNLSRRESL